MIKEQETINLSPMAVLVSLVLGSGAGGVGSNYLVGDYKMQQLKEDIKVNVAEIKDLRNSINALMQIQNECVTRSKILEFRLKNREKK